MTTVDIIVGARIKQRRLELGMTQTELADLIEVRFQQVQKYENGQNRVAASRLWRIASALDVAVNYFFDGIETVENATVPTNGDDCIDPRRKRELVELFTGLTDQQQSAVMSFLRSVADPSSPRA